MFPTVSPAPNQATPDTGWEAGLQTQTDNSEHCSENTHFNGTCPSAINSRPLGRKFGVSNLVILTLS